MFSFNKRAFNSVFLWLAGIGYVFNSIILRHAPPGFVIENNGYVPAHIPLKIGISFVGAKYFLLLSNGSPPNKSLTGEKSGIRLCGKSPLRSASLLSKF